MVESKGMTERGSNRGKIKNKRKNKRTNEYNKTIEMKTVNTESQSKRSTLKPHAAEKKTKKGIERESMMLQRLNDILFVVFLPIQS